MSEVNLSRKHFIHIGLGAAGVAVLTGCGNAGTATLPVKTSSETREGVNPGEAIAAEDDIEPNSAVSFTNAETGEPQVLVRLPSEEFVAYSAVCTHQACIVAYQTQTEKLACPCHGGVFDPAKGAEVVSGPPPTPLPKVAFEVRAGKVFLA